MSHLTAATRGSARTLGHRDARHHRALARHRRRRRGRPLTEGGPHLLGALLAADLLDELCLTTTPLLEGPLPGRIVAGGESPGEPLATQRPARLAHLLHDPESGTLLARWTLA